MAIKLIHIISIVLVSMVAVGNAIKCHTGGETQTGQTIPITEIDCTSTVHGITYKNKCFVTQFKNSKTKSNFIARGCMIDIPNAEVTCGLRMEKDEVTIKGCCCDRNLCNDDDFQNQCTRTSSGRALSTNIIVISLMFAVFKFLIN